MMQMTMLMQTMMQTTGDGDGFRVSWLNVLFDLNPIHHFDQKCHLFVSNLTKCSI
jgi:hypothetical protein